MTRRAEARTRKASRFVEVFMVVVELSLIALLGEAGLDRGLNGFLRGSGALLDAAEEFVRLAFLKLEIVVGERRPFLFEGAFENVPVAFDV